MKEHKKIRWSHINRIVILVIFLVLASLAFYFTFKGSQNIRIPPYMNDTKPINNHSDLFRPAEEMVDYYRNNQQVQSPKTCIDIEYLHYINWINQLRYKFIDEKELITIVSLYSNFKYQDEKSSKQVQTLQDLIVNNQKYSLSKLKDSYLQMRFKVSKKFYTNKFYNSFLPKWFFSVVKIYVKGSSATNAGAPELQLETAYKHLESHDIKHAYQVIESLKDDYDQETREWLQYCEEYIKTQAIIDTLHNRFHSKEYRDIFIKECK